MSKIWARELFRKLTVLVSKSGDSLIDADYKLTPALTHKNEAENST